MQCPVTTTVGILVTGESQIINNSSEFGQSKLLKIAHNKRMITPIETTNDVSAQPPRPQRNSPYRSYSPTANGLSAVSRVIANCQSPFSCTLDKAKIQRWRHVVCRTVIEFSRNWTTLWLCFSFVFYYNGKILYSMSNLWAHALSDRTRIIELINSFVYGSIETYLRAVASFLVGLGEELLIKIIIFLLFLNCYKYWRK